MKTYKHLWEEFISDDNIKLAIKNMRKGKTKRQSVINFLNQENVIEKIRRIVMNYRNARHKPIQIYDGIQRKKRTIIVPTVIEQVVHHMIVNVLKPIINKGMYEHSYGSIPGRGGHKAMRRLKRRIKKGGKNYKYCLKLDIKKFFESIPHEILLSKCKRVIWDEKFMNVLEIIISATEKGIPLGFYTSQWLANWYLQDLDHYIKEKLGAFDYVRYMDDMVLFDSSKKRLHAIKIGIEEFLSKNLGLKLKENWQLFKFHFIKKNEKEIGRFLDFMGFRFYRNRVTLRKSIMLKATRKARKVHSKDKPTVYDAKQSLAFLGWIDATNTYQMYNDKIKPFLSFKKMKRIVSKHDKKEARRIKCGDYLKIQAA